MTDEERKELDERYNWMILRRKGLITSDDIKKVVDAYKVAKSEEYKKEEFYKDLDHYARIKISEDIL